MNLFNIELPEEPSSPIKKIFNAIYMELEEKFFKQLSRHEFEQLFLIQKDKNYKEYLKQKLVLFYKQALENDSGKFDETQALVLWSVHMKEKSDEADLLRKETLNSFLETLSFAGLVERYLVIMENFDNGTISTDYCVDAFSKHLINKVSKDEQFSLIEKACVNYNDYCYEQISLKIEKKLNIVFG